MEQLIIAGVLLIVGYGFGNYLETRHYKYIRLREKRLINKPSVNLRSAPLENKEVISSELAIGSTVVSVDYFKRFLAGLRLVFGGRLTSYESLLDRARREALLRMKESVKNADIYLNVRIETSSISKGRNEKSVGSIEAVAYSTAVKFKEVS
ncbi:MAG: heavy metal-binding domain-containing protein [Bacteriovoracaceae bacterium]|nr:heavy metal-binding domain-containing protein [Bacteriovoracaceae bacterium]